MLCSRPVLPPPPPPACRAAGQAGDCPKNATDSEFWGVEYLVNSTL